MPPGSVAPLGRRAEEAQPFSAPLFSALVRCGSSTPRRQAPLGRGALPAPSSVGARRGPPGAVVLASAPKCQCQALLVLTLATSCPRSGEGKSQQAPQQPETHFPPRLGRAARAALLGSGCLGAKGSQVYSLWKLSFENKRPQTSNSDFIRYSCRQPN